jgi:hypothetical protein
MENGHEDWESVHYCRDFSAVTDFITQNGITVGIISSLDEILPNRNSSH